MNHMISCLGTIIVNSYGFEIIDAFVTFAISINTEILGIVVKGGGLVRSAIILIIVMFDIIDIIVIIDHDDYSMLSSLSFNFIKRAGIVGA